MTQREEPSTCLRIDPWRKEVGWPVSLVPDISSTVFDPLIKDVCSGQLMKKIGLG